MCLKVDLRQAVASRNDYEKENAKLQSKLDEISKEALEQVQRCEKQAKDA